MKPYVYEELEPRPQVKYYLEIWDVSHQNSEQNQSANCINYIKKRKINKHIEYIPYITNLWALVSSKDHWEGKPLHCLVLESKNPPGIKSLMDLDALGLT